MRVSCWLFASACVICFILGRRSATNWSDDTSARTLTQQKDDSSTIQDLQWELNMRRARSYNGISIPSYNGYSAKCIPDETMKEMNAEYVKSKLHRSKMGLMDGLFHEYTVSSVMQVGEFAYEHLKYDSNGRPIWTGEIWDHYQNQLNSGNLNVGPPQYKNSGKSVIKAINWALQNTLESCGISSSKLCNMAVFSAISPWSEATLHWTAMQQSPSRTVRITSVDFNPCILEDIPPEAIAECRSPLSFVKKRSDDIALFDLTVSYSGIEHDGLGRYGDPINPEGDISAMREMWLLTRPGGILLLAVPRAGKNYQPLTNIPIWGNKKIQVLQHRAYGAERYMRLLVGWAFEGFVIDGRDVIEFRSTESKMMSIVRMLQCSFVREHSEHQPLLILRKLEDMTFDDVLVEGDSWVEHNAQLYEEEYRLADKSGNLSCSTYDSTHGLDINRQAVALR